MRGNLMPPTRIVSTRAEGEPPVPGSIKRPCLADASHMVWVSPASQSMLTTVDGAICLECLAEEMKQRAALKEALGQTPPEPE